MQRIRLRIVIQTRLVLVKKSSETPIILSRTHFFSNSDRIVLLLFANSYKLSPTPPHFLSYKPKCNPSFSELFFRGFTLDNFISFSLSKAKQLLQAWSSRSRTIEHTRCLKEKNTCQFFDFTIYDNTSGQFLIVFLVNSVVSRYSTFLLFCRLLVICFTEPRDRLFVYFGIVK